MNPYRTPILVLAALVSLLAGCGTPAAVKDLGQQTQTAASRMGDLHQQDLRELAEYDRQRVAQFNRLLNDYLALRGSVLNALNDALDQSKRAAIAELDAEFDRQAEHITSGLFWAQFRSEADKDLDRFMLKQRENADSQGAAAQVYKVDVAQEKQALLAARQRYLAAAMAYETVESSYADLIVKVDQARTSYHIANLERFNAIDRLSLPDTSADIRSFTLPNNSAVITERIASLNDAYTQLDKAHGELVRYLNENNPGKTFVVAVAGATLGATVASDAAKTTVPSAPTDPSGIQPPDLSGLLGKLSSALGKVTTAKTTGSDALAPAISSLVASVKPVVKVLSTPVP